MLRCVGHGRVLVVAETRENGASGVRLAVPVADVLYRIFHCAHTGNICSISQLPVGGRCFLSVAGDIYHGDDTSIWYDNDGDQHVEVGWDF